MRLLLAEDEQELSHALTAIFKHNHYSVDAVHNGRDALDYLLAGTYDAAVLDVMMPGLDGISVVRQAREQGCSLPILLLTAKSEIDDRVTGLDAGADDYLTKPFSTKELLARIRAMTRRQAEVTSSVLQLGNLTLDRVSFELSTAKGSFRLASKEFQMMEMLMSRPGVRITTEQFMEHVWGYDSEAEINVVWVYLSYLRKKLASLEANVQIHAFRGIGYTLEVKP